MTKYLIGAGIGYALLGGLVFVFVIGGVCLIVDSLTFGLVVRLFFGGTMIALPLALIYILRKK